MSDERIDIDLSDITTPFTILDDGEVIGRVGDAKFQNSKTSGNPMLVLRWDVPVPENPDEVVFINDYLPLNRRQSLFRIRQLCEVGNIDLKNWAGDLSQFVGLEAPLHVVREESDDFGPQNRVKRVLVEVPQR